jgi:hypothetical protein
MATSIQELSQNIATLERQLVDTTNEVLKKSITKKIERLKEELRSGKAQSKELLSSLTKARKEIKTMAETDFKGLIAKLKKLPEYAFLKSYTIPQAKRDIKKVAKPVGYRFVGDNIKKPTLAQIKKGLKDGTVYYEARPIRSDVSQVAQLENGGNLLEKYPNATKKSLKEIAFLLDKGYEIDTYSGQFGDVVFGDDDNSIIVTQGIKRDGKVITECAVAYLYEDKDSGVMSIDLDLIKEISRDFKGYPVIVYTNAGVDLHSKEKGKYSNVTFERFPVKFEKGGDIGKDSLNFRIVPMKSIKIEGSPNLIEPYYSLAYTVKGSLLEANKSAQEFVKNNENIISATVTKIHPSGQPLKNKKVSYVTKDEIQKYEKGGSVDEIGRYEVDRFKQLTNEKVIAKYIVRLEDYSSNKSTYVFGFKLIDRFKGCELEPYEVLYSGWSVSGSGYSLSNLQVTPLVPNDFTKMFFTQTKTDILIEKIIRQDEEGAKKFLEKEYFDSFSRGSNFEKILKEFISESVKKFVRCHFEIIDKFEKGGSINDPTKGGYFKNEIDNDYIERINDYFLKWHSINDEKEAKAFEDIKPPLFGTYEDRTILDQIRHFEKLKIPFSAHEVIRNQFKKEVSKIIEKWIRKKMEQGGEVEERLVGSFYLDTRKDKTFQIIYSDKDKISIQYFNKQKEPIGKIEDVDISDFKYLTSMGAWGKWKQPYFEDGGNIDSEKLKEVSEAIFDANSKKGRISTAFGDKTLQGLTSMIENTNYSSKEITDAIFDSNEKSGKVNTNWGSKTKEGLIAMIDNARGLDSKENGGNINDKWESMTEKEFLRDYFSVSVFGGVAPTKYFEIERISSGNDSKIEKFIEEYKSKGFAIKKKSFSEFTSVMAVKKKDKFDGGGNVTEIYKTLAFFSNKKFQVLDGKLGFVDVKKAIGITPVDVKHISYKNELSDDNQAFAEYSIKAIQELCNCDEIDFNLMYSIDKENGVNTITKATAEFNGRPLKYNTKEFRWEFSNKFERGGSTDDQRFENWKKNLIKFSDSYDKGEGFSSRFVGAKNKKGDVSNGEYLIDGQEINWTYTDKQGKEYSSTEIPFILVDLTDSRMLFKEGGNLDKMTLITSVIIKTDSEDEKLDNHKPISGKYFDIKDIYLEGKNTYILNLYSKNKLWYDISDNPILFKQELMTKLAELLSTVSNVKVKSLRIPKGVSFEKGGSIGFIPIDLEEDLVLVAEWCMMDMRNLIEYLNAFVDAGITPIDFKQERKNTHLQREKETKRMIDDIWKKSAPFYKGEDNNREWSLINRLSRQTDIITRFQPYRKYQKFEKGGNIDNKFTYMMLSRLQLDNEAFLNGISNRAGSEKGLWAGNVEDQIAEMKKLWNSLKEKPEWLSMEDIQKYERKMKELKKEKQFAFGGEIDDNAYMLDVDDVNFHVGDEITLGAGAFGKERPNCVITAIDQSNITFKDPTDKSISGTTILSNYHFRNLVKNGEITKKEQMAKGGAIKTPEQIKERLEEIRESIQAENISYGEIAELQSYADYIDADDVELRQWAGIPEFEDEEEFAKGGAIKNSMSFKEFSESLQEYEIEGGFGKTLEKGYRMYYLPNDNPYLNTKFPHRNKRKAYQEFIQQIQFEKGGAIKIPEQIKERLEEIRESIQAENISYGEIAELQSYADYIDAGDVELRQWAGIPEFEDEEEFAKGGAIKNSMSFKEFSESLQEYEIEGGFGKTLEKGYRMYYLPNDNPYLNTKFPHRNKRKAYQEFIQQIQFEKGGAIKTPEQIKERLEEIRESIQAENISYGEIAELQSYADYIDADDVELRQWAGIPEFEDEEEFAKGGAIKNSMSFKEFSESLQEYEIEGGFGKTLEKGYRMYYLPNDNPYLNTKFPHRNKRKAYQEFIQQIQFEKGGAIKTPEQIKERLEEIRESIQAENISYGEIAELQSYADYIDAGDVELRQWAGIPEFEDEEEFAKGGKVNDEEHHLNLLIKEITSKYPLRAEGIKKWMSDNNLTKDDLVAIISGLGRKMVDINDFTTAIVGEPKNEYSKAIIEFAKSGKAYELTKTKESNSVKEIEKIGREIKEGDLVWNKEDGRYGIVLGIYDEEPNEVRLDSTGMTSIFESDKDWNIIGLNLVQAGAEGDEGTLENLESVKKSARGYVSRAKEDKNKENIRYYTERTKRLLNGEFDEAVINKSKTNYVEDYYIPHNNIISVTFKSGKKNITVSKDDVLNGVNLKFENGGSIQNTHDYISHQNIVNVVVKGMNGIEEPVALKSDEFLNGFWVKKNAKVLKEPKAIKEDVLELRQQSNKEDQFEKGGDVLGFDYDIVIDNKPLIQIFKNDYLDVYNVFYYIKKDEIPNDIQRIFNGKKTLTPEEASSFYGKLLLSTQIGKSFTVEASSKFATGGYVRPSNTIKTTGRYTFTTTPYKTYNLEVVMFERHGDDTDSLQVQDGLRNELGSIIIKNSDWRKLSKGERIKAKSSKGHIGFLVRTDDLFKDGGNVNSTELMARGGDVRYKIAGVNFATQIENARKFKELISKAYESQNSEDKYPEEFIKETAHTGNIVKNDGSIYLKNYSYNGTITKFDFLDNKYFLEALKYLDRPSIRNFKFEEGGNIEEPIPMYIPVTGKKVASVAVSDDLYTSQLNRFIDYVTDFYEEEGYSKAEIKKACKKYIEELGYQKTWGGGDSLDRERVYEILKNPNSKSNNVNSTTTKYSIDKLFSVGDIIFYEPTWDTKLDESVKRIINDSANRDLVIESIENDKPFNLANVYDKETGKKVSGQIVLNPKVVFKSTGKFEEGGNISTPATVDGFKLVYEKDLPQYNPDFDNVSGTIRTSPQNNYVASVNSDKTLEFKGMDGSTKNIDQTKVTELWEANLIPQDKNNERELTKQLLTYKPKEKLRSIKVTYDNGKVIHVSMASGLSDKEMLEYYKVGKTFNIGDGENDLLAKVVSAEITDNEHIFEKGGKIDPIDMAEVEKSALFRTDESRWSVKPTIEGFQDKIKEMEELKRQLDAKEITPSKVIGTGFKSHLARAIAERYIEKNILIDKRAIEILKERQPKVIGIGSTVSFKSVTGETKTGTVVELLGNSGFKVKTDTGNAFIKKEDVI